MQEALVISVDIVNECVLYIHKFAVTEMTRKHTHSEPVAPDLQRLEIQLSIQYVLLLG